jgi:hypothetical protein
MTHGDGGTSRRSHPNKWVLVALIAVLALPAKAAQGSAPPESARPQIAPPLTPQRLPLRDLSLADGARSSARGLQDGWAIDNSCHVMFTPEVAAVIADSGAAWVRINFRLGAAQSWTEMATCGGISALDLYDAVVDNARAEGLRVLGLLSNESWPGAQADWQANSAERNPGSSGDNSYLAGFSQHAAGVLVRHFSGRVAAWEVWNEPNAYTSYSPGTGYIGSTFIYPSNFAWLLRRVFEEAQAAGANGTLLVAGGVFGHDLPSTLTPEGRGLAVKRGDPQTPGYSVPPESEPAGAPAADPIALKSGAEYLRSTYAQGIALAGWAQLRQLYGSYPLDAVGQHLYVDQGTITTSGKVGAYLDAVRAVPLEHPEVAPPPSWITEVGWTTASVPEAVQATNLGTAFDAFAAAAYVGVGFWFQLRDIAAAGMYYGLLTPFDPPWTRKAAWSVFRRYRNFAPLIMTAPGALRS